LLGPVHYHRVGTDAVVGSDETPEAGVGLAQLLVDETLAEDGHSLAAVLLRKVNPEEAELAHTLEHRVGEAVLLPLLGVGSELLLHEALDRLAQSVVFLGEDEVLAGCSEIGLDLGYGSGHQEPPVGMRYGGPPLTDPVWKATTSYSKSKQ
ncbi:hypothetical protein LCGC14_0875860, partial [marine sediment metagenome]